MNSIEARKATEKNIEPEIERLFNACITAVGADSYLAKSSSLVDCHHKPKEVIDGVIPKLKGLGYKVSLKYFLFEPEYILITW